MQTANKPDSRYVDIMQALPSFYRLGNHIKNAGELEDYTVVAIELTRSGISAIVTLEYEDGRRTDLLITIPEGL